jgi:hypothetical protein
MPALRNSSIMSRMVSRSLLASGEPHLVELAEIVRMNYSTKT